MKATGMVRKVDQLGRLVLPKEIRSVRNIEEFTPMEIFVEGEMIVLKKYNPSCVFCGDAENVQDFKGKKICKKCLQELKK